MASVGAQPQFRYTQPPSKVLHLRNLPWECAEEELIELCKPFGKVVNTKCNVGANRNQAFVEFADLNQAISMVSYHASSSEPAQIRGKTVYLQYSNRQEIVNNKNTGEIASNVLLVTIEGVEAGDVSIDILHLVFSAFGFVHKIATFEKAAGFQALVQFSDPNTASAARSALDGRSIPRYLLPDRVGPCHLRISFSAHSDLNVKFQSHRSRDYTNPDLPVAPSAIDGTGQFDVGPDGKRKEAESNVLLASIENMQYAVTIDVLHAVFSAFGTVQKIAMFEKNAGFQALVQYADVQTAIVAREALEGHCIYDGDFCKLHLSYSRHTNLNVKVNNDRSRDYTSPNPGLLQNQLSILGQQPSTVRSTLPIPIGVSPAAPSGYTGNQLIGGIPPRHVDTVTRPPPPQGWGFDITNTVVPGAGFASMPATSPMNGPGGSSMPGGPHASAGGRPFHAGMFPPQQNSFLRAPYPPAGVSGASTSVPITGPPVGHMFTGSNMNAVPPPPQSMAPFSRDQLIPTPGPMAMPAVSRPTAYYM